MLTQVDSLSMEQVIDIALSQSPAYYESKTSLDKSRIQFYQTLSNLLPTLSATAEYTEYESNSAGIGSYSGRLTLTQPLFDLDIISSIFLSNRELKSTSVQHKADIAGLMLNTKTAYYDLIYANELFESAELAIKRANENMEIIETKYKIGAASKLDKLQAEVFYLSTLQDKAKALTLQTTAQEQLKSLLASEINIYPTDSLMPPSATEFPSIDSLVILLKEVNYGIQIAQELESAARLEVVSSYLSFLPKISFFYGYTYSSDELVFDFQEMYDNSTKNYGISVSFPIFEIKSLVFNNLNAKKELQLKEFSKERIALENEKSLRTTYSALHEAYDRLQFATKSLDAATEAATIAKEQYALGTISFLELLTAEEDAYDARVSYTSSLSDFYVQKVNLSYLLGGFALD
jgi:outer membrane protein TolC